MALSPKAKSEEVITTGAIVGQFPALGGIDGGAFPYIVTSSEIAFGSLATNFSRRVIPFNFKVLDFYTKMITAPVGSAAARKIVLGTATSQSLYFVTGNLVFNSSSPLTLIRRGTATNFQTAAALLGTAGMLLTVTAKPTATVLSTKGAFVGIVICVAR
jgi:hypothetical protein